MYLESGGMADRMYWYLQAWKSALVPVCRLERGGRFTDCTDFRPSPTNEGLCFTRNGGDFDTIYRRNSYSSAFKEIILSGRGNDPIRYNRGSGIQYQYSFFVDTNRQNDFKRGIFWKKNSDKALLLGIHSPNDVADIKGSGIDIHPGYETTIRVSFQELYSDPKIKNTDPIKRGCKFDHENTDLNIFKWYSRVNYLFECRMALVEKECGCRPWDYPTHFNKTLTSLNKDSRICEYFGNTCFHELMKTEFGEEQCLEKCFADCNKVKHTFSVEKTPLSKESICRYSAMDRMAGAFGDKRKMKAVKDLDESLKNHVSGFPQSTPKWGKIYPITTLIRISQNILNNQNRSNLNEEMCKERLMNDVAVVHIVVSNPTVLKLIQTNRLTFTDKLANFGKMCSIFCIS